jgi:hypothetical protein
MDFHISILCVSCPTILWQAEAIGKTGGRQIGRFYRWPHLTMGDYQIAPAST